MLFHWLNKQSIIILFFLIFYLLALLLPIRRYDSKSPHRIISNLIFGAIIFGLSYLGFYTFIYFLIEKYDIFRFSLFSNFPVNKVALAILTFVIIDYSQYHWHKMNHKFKFLWRFHSIHHSDDLLDTSTSFRFHFGEILFSQIFRFTIIIIFGFELKDVILYDFISQLFIFFHHSNLKIPFNKNISYLFITPAIHSVHHSIHEADYNKNFSVVFSFWDRIHRTKKYTDYEKLSQTGLLNYSNAKELKLWHLLISPFQK